MSLLDYISETIRGWASNVWSIFTEASAENILFKWIITVVNFITLQASNILGFGSFRDQVYGVLSFASFGAFLFFSPIAFVTWILLLSPFLIIALLRAIPQVEERWPLPEQDWQLFDD